MTLRRFFRVRNLAVVLVLLGGGCVSTAQLLFTPWKETTIPGAVHDRVPFKDGTLNVFRAGAPEGQRVIFVHGTPGGAADWEDLLTQPAAGLEYLAYDRPGFGHTQPTRAVPALADQAAALEPLLVEGNGQWPILVGHSLGGPIVCQAAADFPGKVGGLVIVAGSLDPAHEKVYFIQRLGNTLALRWLVPRVLRNANSELLPLKQELEALAPRLKSIACPVVIVHGTKDVLVPFENVAFMQTRFAPNALRQVKVLEGENHFLPWTNPTAIREAIQAILVEPEKP
ncbi:MAG: alpha/beta hydrolase [Candidatus Hydrogenedentes bacterium]|nr:alpha/beta hydrolase [Candidatus Hydrogenedentota bacterium]